MMSDFITCKAGTLADHLFDTNLSSFSKLAKVINHEIYLLYSSSESKMNDKDVFRSCRI